jgi:hypothetical protein
VKRNNNLPVIRLASPHRALGFVEPRADPNLQRAKHGLQYELLAESIRHDLQPSTFLPEQTLDQIRRSNRDEAARTGKEFSWALPLLTENRRALRPSFVHQLDRHLVPGTPHCAGTQDRGDGGMEALAAAFLGKSIRRSAGVPAIVA